MVILAKVDDINSTEGLTLGEKTSFIEEKITNMFPETLRDMYDGSEESMYDIIELQLMLHMNDPDLGEDNDE